MTKITVLVPSRGRPHMMNRLVDAWTQTITGDTRLVVITDADDDRPAYTAALNSLCADRPWLEHVVQEPRRLGPTLNEWGPAYAADCDILGFTGDDHLPRTHGWDIKIGRALAAIGTGVAYGNDLVHGEGLATAAFLTSDIILALGKMVPEGFEHMFLDNYWMGIGRGVGRLRYVPEVVIEHMHPIIGKGEVDATYETVWPMQQTDGVLWERYLATGGMQADVDAVAALL